MSGDGTAKSEPGGADYDELISSICRRPDTTVLWPLKTDAVQSQRSYPAYHTHLVIPTYTRV